MTEPTDPGRARDPRVDELACIEAQEEEFLRAGGELGPGEQARLDRLAAAVGKEALRDARPKGRRTRRRVIALVVPAVAAAAAALLLFVVPRGKEPGSEAPILRGDAIDVIAPLESAVGGEGGTTVVRLRWPRQDDADSYVVLVLDADRSTVARVEAGGSPHAEWEVPAAFRGRALEWVVIARREGRELRRSAVERLGTGAPRE